jgi:hypothetical protein
MEQARFPPGFKKYMLLFGYQMASGALVPDRIFETASRKSPFTLSWSHYVELLKAKLLEWMRAEEAKA